MSICSDRLAFHECVNEIKVIGRLHVEANIKNHTTCNVFVANLFKSSWIRNVVASWIPDRAESLSTAGIHFDLLGLVGWLVGG